MKINSCVAIHFRCRGQVELIDRYLTAMLVPDEERGRRENVVMNLLRWAAIFEDQRDRLLVARDLRRMRRLICGLIGTKRRGFRLARFTRLKTVSIGCRRLRIRRIVIPDVIWVSNEIRVYSHRVRKSHSVWRNVRPAMA